MPFAGGWMSVGKQLGLLLIVWQKRDLFIRCAEVGLSSARKSHFPTIWILEHNRRRSVWFSRGGIGVQTRFWSKEFTAIMRSLCGWYRSFWKVCQSVQPLSAVTVWFTAWCGKHFRRCLMKILSDKDCGDSGKSRIVSSEIYYGNSICEANTGKSD